MIKIFIACDDNDPNLGEYFGQCKTSMNGFLNEQNFLKSVEIASGHQCNRVYIELKLDDFVPQKIIFIAYSHGKEDSLWANSEIYVRMGDNSSKFKDYLFYSNACSCGKHLGPRLIEDGCSAFIGYEKEIQVLIDHSKIFEECDNSGLYLFLAEDITIFEAFQRMKNFFTNRSGRLNILDQAILIDARDALVFYGSKDLRKEDFINIDN